MFSEALDAALTAYEHRDKLREAAHWLWARIAKGEANVVVFGSAGAGKSTLGAVLAGREVGPDYDDSTHLETYRMAGGVPCSILVPPGQASARAATWTDLLRKVATGRASTVLHVVSWGLTPIGDRRFSEVPGYEPEMSVEALAESLQKLGTAEVAVRVIRQAVGQITESDVLLAAASDAIIVGFHVRPDAKARELAEREKVEIRLYDIIYKAVEDVKQALEGMLKPELKEVILGVAEVRQVFRLSKGSVVAGCMVSTGKISRNEQVRLVRAGETVFTGKVDMLKRFKDDVREVQQGYECGITLNGSNDIQEGDRLESFKVEELARTL